MTLRQLRRRLTRLLKVAPPASHQALLREGLVARLRPREPARFSLSRWLVWSLAGLAIGLAAVSQAPAQYDIQLGQRVAIAGVANALWPDGPALRATVLRYRPAAQTHVWAVRAADGTTTLYVDLLDEISPSNSAPRPSAEELVHKLQSDFPALKAADTKVLPLEVKAYGKLIDLVGHTLTGRPATEVKIRALRAFDGGD